MKSHHFRCFLAFFEERHFGCAVGRPRIKQSSFLIGKLYLYSPVTFTVVISLDTVQEARDDLPAFTKIAQPFIQLLDFLAQCCAHFLAWFKAWLVVQNARMQDSDRLDLQSSRAQHAYALRDLYFRVAIVTVARVRACRLQQTFLSMWR